MASKLGYWGENKPPLGWSLNQSVAEDLNIAGAWLLNEVGGLFVTDLVSGLIATFNGGINYACPIAGGINSVNWPVLKLNGTTGYLNLGTNFGIGPLTNYPFSISFWVCPTSLSNADSEAIGFYDGTHLFQIDFKSDGSIRPAWGTGGFDAFATATGIIVVNRWYHVVITFSSTGALGVYLNGAGVGSGMSVTSSFASATGLHFGNRGGDNAEYFTGYLDLPVIALSCWTPNQVNDVYLNPFCFAQAPKRRLWNTTSAAPAPILEDLAHTPQHQAVVAM